MSNSAHVPTTCCDRDRYNIADRRVMSLVSGVRCESSVAVELATCSPM